MRNNCVRPWLRTLVLVGGLIAWLSIAGCGPSKRPGELPVYPVSGRVTYQGQPMPFATITFFPANQPFAQAMKSRAIADKNGVYQLTTYEKNDGAPEGEYRAVLYVPLKEPDPYELEVPNPPDRLKHAYIDPAKTKLKYQVKPTPNTIDITLP